MRYAPPDELDTAAAAAGFVVADRWEDFERHPYVINGCSELFAKVWGDDNGVGVRSAVGMGSLPDNIPVEIEAMFELV